MKEGITLTIFPGGFPSELHIKNARSESGLAQADLRPLFCVMKQASPKKL